MKRLLIVMAVVLFMATPAMADVLLTWDERPATENVDMYQVEMDGQVVADVVPNTYSVVNVIPGQHTARVRAHNTWGWGAFSNPLDFTKAMPGVVQNIRLEVK